MKTILASVFALGFAVGALSACGEADELIDCQKICSRYQGCFDADYDVGACRNRCEDKADKESGFAKKVDDCESCIDDKSCTSATFSCGIQCAGVVP